MPNEIKLTSFEILYSVSRELTSSLDLHQVLARVLVLSTENLGAERASLIVLNQSGQPVDSAIIYDGSLRPATLQQMEDVLRSGLAGWVIQHKQPVLVPNTHHDKRWFVKRGKSEPADKAKSALCVPLMARESLVGVLTIVHPQINFFTDEDFKLQKAIADLAGIAIFNAQLFEDVQSARNRYQDLFASNIDPIFITNLDGKILEANQQAMVVTGYTQEELVSQEISAFLDNEDSLESAETTTNQMEQVIKTQSLLQTSSGTSLPVEVHTTHITIQGERSIQWILRDIRERMNLDALREDLSAMIYHDLRSPLANIISSMELMRDSLGGEQMEQVNNLFEIANRSTARMQRLISSLLDISRLEAGQPITVRTDAKVEKLIDEAEDAVTPLLNSRNLKLEKLVPSVIPPLKVDEDMTRRVIINLLENACKYSAQNTTITIGAKLNGKLITIWVDDKGPGIPKEAQDSIFEKFVRLHGNSPIHGLGLGLAFCRIAVQAHGGKIWVENLPEGGSRFTFTLPASLGSKKGD